MAIELDGQHHYTAGGNLNDQERTAFLNANNINVLRFENRLVFENIEGVLDEISNMFSKK